MKRRILAFTLALVLAVSMGGAALAVGGPESQDVTVTVIQKDIQSTHIAWDPLDFVFTFSSEDAGAWNKTSATVTVTNNSNYASLGVSSSMESKGTVPNVTVSYTGNGTVTTLDPNGGSTTYTVSVGGTPAQNKNIAATIVGTITVTFS